jgi:prophage regulatory protein
MNHMYLSDRALAARYDTSRATVWRWVETRGLPKPIRFSSGCTRWKLSDIERWEAELAGEESRR